jgi:hypothetical protein
VTSDTLTYSVEDFGRYTKYIETVLYEDNNFESTYDVLTRFDTLQRINAQLVKAIEFNEGEAEQIRNNMTKFIKVTKIY